LNNRLQQRLYTILKNPNARDPENEDSSSDSSSNNMSDIEEKENIYGITNPADYIKTLTKQMEENVEIDSLNTQIFGMPHQFLPSADARLDSNSNFGYGFFNQIYIEKPIVTLMPGKMLYLPAYSKSNKKLFNSLSADDSQHSRDALQDLIKSEEGSRYYDFTSDYTAYMNYVNLMCRVAAVYLGLDEEDPLGNKYKAPDGGSYKTYDWKKYHSINGYSPKNTDSNVLSVVKDFFETVVDDVTTGTRCYVNFYIDPNTSVSENISNTTQSSQLEGAFDSVEGIVKEAQMLLNSVGSGFVNNVVDAARNTVGELINGVTLGLFSDMLGVAGEQVLHGANLIYPEIWTDSDYSKSFSVQINLCSPYGSKEAVYLNVLVPLFHLLCLALPRQSSPNSFTSPFLIRGYSQGWFSIDMGMVESIQIDKGDDKSWTVEGLPTSAKVTLNIKELYDNLMMSPSTRPSFFFSNQGLIDYLGVACAVDMTIPNIYFNFRLAGALLAGKFKDIPNNTYYYATQSVRNIITRKFKL
jgi:hypothetical protein